MDQARGMSTRRTRRRGVVRPPVVGMVGAGQLARMTCGGRDRAGHQVPRAGRPPRRERRPGLRRPVLGDYRSTGDLLAFAAGCDVVTFDHEHVPEPQLAALEQAGHAVRPGSAALRFTQDKLAMRDAAGQPRRAVPAVRAGGQRSTDVAGFAAATDWPVVLKAVIRRLRRTRRLGLPQPAEAAEVLSHGLSLLVEEFVPFERELAMLVARSPSGHGAAYPVVQTVQRDGICVEVLAPAPGLADDLRIEAQRLGLELARDLDVIGLLAVELFETRRRPAGQRARHAAAQQRALDDRGRQDLAVRAAPARRAEPAARLADR